MKATPHTLVLLHSPQALRAELDLTLGALDLWWSPGAGTELSAFERNRSSRDDPFRPFASIALPGLQSSGPVACIYDPYDCSVRIGERSLRLTMHLDAPAITLSSDRRQLVRLKTHRYDRIERASARHAHAVHGEEGRFYRFHVALGAGAGTLRTSPPEITGYSGYIDVDLESGQSLVLCASCENESPPLDVRRLLASAPDALRQQIDLALEPHEATARTDAPAHPEAENVRRLCIRGLHSMIDEGGAMRASIKAVYYLIWVRDSGFAFHFQACAGWTHRLGELCRFLASNPTIAFGEGIPKGRMFAQLIHPTLGKYEEDGVYYAVLAHHTLWTQTGSRGHLGEEALAVLADALSWVETYCFDHERGLFGGYFADETPAYGSRDHRWDHAIGQPSGDEHIRHEGISVTRCYDIYLNTLMHSAWTMFAEMLPEAEAAPWRERASRLEPALLALLSDQVDDLPPYGDLRLIDGRLARARAWGPAHSVYLWALALPNRLPVPFRQRTLRALLRRIREKPRLHFVNGIAAVIAALDPWHEGESEALDMLKEIARQTLEPGTYLPMAGAMPEKFDAPQGDPYHDIRPQAFAMASWLAAWTSLGVRRLHQGLALRPTRAYRSLENYEWRGARLSFRFPSSWSGLAITRGNLRADHTLQLPESMLVDTADAVDLVNAPPGPLLLASSARLLFAPASTGAGAIAFRLHCNGSTEVTFSVVPSTATLDRASGESQTLPIDADGAIRFRFQGECTLSVQFPDAAASLPCTNNP